MCYVLPKYYFSGEYEALYPELLVALTALGAIKEGYSVIVNETAIGTMFLKNKEKYFKKLRDADVKFI